MAELDKWEKQYTMAPQFFWQANETFGGDMSVRERVKGAGQDMWKLGNVHVRSFRDYHQ